MIVLHITESTKIDISTLNKDLIPTDLIDLKLVERHTVMP